MAAAKSRGGHGGARGGAGRPPLLSWEQVTWFCALLENEWNRLARAEAKRRGLGAELRRAKRREPYLTEDEIENLGKQNLYAVPLSERRERAAQTDELGEGDHAIDEMVANTREFIRITSRMNVSPGRHPTMSPTPPGNTVATGFTRVVVQKGAARL